MSAAPASAWRDACAAAALFAVDPGLGGVSLRAAHGPVRSAWLDLLKHYLPPQAPVRRAPASVDQDALLGGLDLAATLRAGRPVARAGLLAGADKGVLLIAMAERVPAATAALIVAALESGEVMVGRDGVALQASARFGIVALDEGLDDERPSDVLLDRMAFLLDLDTVAPSEMRDPALSPQSISSARARLGAVGSTPADIATVVIAAAQLGVASLRAPLLCLRAARAACALRGGSDVETEDLVLAGRLVLAPRATQVPAPADDDVPEQDTEQESTPDTDPADAPQDEAAQALPDLTDLVIAAAAAAIPANLLARIQAGVAARGRAERAGKSGAEARSGKRGAPMGARKGEPRNGRTAVIDTLRAAAPWQGVRRRGLTGDDTRRVIVHREDFRIKRYRERRETSAIFVVDASGSSAMHRLAEVKGAIELLLADCYVRRDKVALVAFRGASGEIVLPPTRSLARAKRSLAALPGGGGTPIAAGLDTALALADGVRRKGQTPLLVLMTDGRANIARDGAPGRARALEDALDAGRRIRAAGIAALAIDTSSPVASRDASPTLKIGEAMNARYVKLPFADAARVSEAVRAATLLP